MKNQSVLLLILVLGSSAAPETVAHSMYIEGRVTGAQRFRKLLKSTTKIDFQEDGKKPDVERRRFCGNWEKQINKLRGKRIRLNLTYKEYAPDKCMKISGIEILN